MTCEELIELLKKFPPKATVGVRASCCGHSHGVVDAKKADDEFYDHHKVVLDARE